MNSDHEDARFNRDLLQKFLDDHPQQKEQQQQQQQQQDQKQRPRQPGQSAATRRIPPATAKQRDGKQSGDQEKPAERQGQERR